MTINQNGNPRSLVLFDLNGTLMDDLDRAVHATNTVLAHHGRGSLDQESFRESFTLPLDTWFTSFGIPPDLIHQVEEKWCAEMQGPSLARSGAREILDRLRGRGAMTGVVSAVSAQAVEADLRRHRLRPLLDLVVGGVKNKARTLHELGRVFPLAYYIGDTAYDVHSAKSAGFVSIAIAGGHQCEQKVRQADPAHFVSSLMELETIIDL